MSQLTLKKPMDCHVHVRDGDALRTTVPHLANTFSRAIVMPNLSPPVLTVEEALAYQARIQKQIPCGLSFIPFMTLYLSEHTSQAQLEKAKAAGILGVKFYPAYATTNAQHGVKNIQQIYPLLETMEAIDLPLLIHGESVEASVDCFDREAHFIDNTLTHLRKTFPKLRIVLEHITTSLAVQWILSHPAKTAATITAHHLLVNRNHLFQEGLHPDLYCLPLLKRRQDQEALIQAAISGNPAFFLGSDSAPHARSKKYTACGCAGIYTGFAALELYAEVFDQAGSLDRLEGFASVYGPQFYGLLPETATVTLTRHSWTVPDFFEFLGDRLTPFRAGQKILWKAS